jgi:AcrR family transcriptional regulator
MGGTKRKAAKQPRRGKPRAYHHGALREALIEAGEALIAERGVDGFTLRETARRAGVSPAAPAHHFGDAAGLLTEIALRGYQELTRTLAAATARAGAEPHAQLRDQGIAYVRFALAFPGWFKLMSRKDMLRDDERLHAAALAALAELERTLRAYSGVPEGHPIDRAAFVAMIGAWATVHGFATLALEGRLQHLGAKLSGTHPAGAEALAVDILPAVLSALWPPRGGGRT